ncbi:MAG: response regulator [Ginsengibacter sp.]
MKKILIVDDDEDILEVVKYLLQSHGFNVSTYATGFNVDEVVKNYNPDLILLDINLPGKSGTQICKELRHKKLTTPIILFSAHADRSKVIAESNADDFIEKPFEIDHLINTISSHLNLVLTVF